MDTVVVGNGILAVTTAFRLAQRASASDRITVIGRKARPGSATLAAAAMLNSFAEVEEGGLQSEIDSYRFELSRSASRMWPAFSQTLMEAARARAPQAHGMGDGVRGGGFERGTYVINNNAADGLDDRNFDAILAALERFDEPHDLVDPRTIPNYAPEQRYRATRAVYIPNEGWLNPRLVMDQADRALAAFPQVHVIDEEVESLVAEGRKIATARLRDGQHVSGDRFLLASGATATDILDRSDLDISVQRIFYGIGVSLQLRSPDSPHTKCIRTPNRGLACGLYTVPYFTGDDGVNDSVLVGASNLMSPKPEEFGRAIAVEALLRGAMEQINTEFYRATLARVNVGFRPTSSDGYPLLGRTSIPNLIIATGTKRDGFHLAPVLSELLADLLHGEGEPVDARFAWFAPERKLIRTLTREQAIQKAVDHSVNAAYQHGYIPSHGRFSRHVQQMYRDELEKLHDKVGAIDWGIPPDMIEMYRYGHVRG